MTITLNLTEPELNALIEHIQFDVGLDERYGGHEASVTLFKKIIEAVDSQRPGCIG